MIFLILFTSFSHLFFPKQKRKTEKRITASTSKNLRSPVFPVDCSIDTGKCMTTTPFRYANARSSPQRSKNPNQQNTKCASSRNSLFSKYNNSILSYSHPLSSVLKWFHSSHYLIGLFAKPNRNTFHRSCYILLRMQCVVSTVNTTIFIVLCCMRANTQPSVHALSVLCKRHTNSCYRMSLCARRSCMFVQHSIECSFNRKRTIRKFYFFLINFHNFQE